MENKKGKENDKENKVIRFKLKKENLINGFSKNELHKLMWKKPSFAQIELTRNCNQSCIFCFAACNSYERFCDSSLVNWKKAIDKLEELGIRTVHFTGGENFMYKYFKTLVKYTKKKGFNVQVNTNGTFDITDILPYTDEFVFSVHGVLDVHDNIVNKKGSFNLICKNVELASLNSKDITINTVLVKQNFKEFIQIFNYFDKRYNIKGFAPTFAVESNNGTEFNESKVLLTKENLEFYFESLRKIPKEKLVLKHGLYGIFDYDKELINRDYPIELPVCAAGKDKLIIKYDGSVYPCNFFLNDNYYCGNIFTDNIQKIWNDGKGFKSFRDIVLENKIPDECNKCKNKKCFSGCRIWTNKYMLESEELGFEKDIRCEIVHAFIGN